MRNKFTAALVACAFVLNAFGTVFADTKAIKKTTQTNTLAALLPASDGVLTIDMEKVLSEAVPQILSGNQPMLTEINSKIDEVREKTGLDLRQFEQVAVGVATKQISAQEIDLEPMFLARGKYNANALITLAKIASKGKYREEKVGSRIVYVFSGKEIVEQNKSVAKSSKNSWFDQAFERMIDGLMKEVAVTSYDGNTLAFGSVARVNETLNAKTRISGELLGLVNRKPNAVAAFGGNLPNSLSNLLGLNNDELAVTLDSIRQMSGAMELVNGDTAVSVTAKTLKVEQAQRLQDMLELYQGLGKSVLGGSKGADKQVYSRMINNAKITRSQTEISFDLQVPQTDINILIGAK